MITTDLTTELSEFRQDAAEHLQRLTQSGGVEILTIDGKRKGVLMSPEAYDRMADLAERAEITDALRRGLAALDAGRVRPAEQVYRDLIAEFALDPAIVYGSPADDACRRGVR